MSTTNNIQSVERAFAILELFSNKKDELSLNEIATALELNKSTAFGLTNTLANLGYLCQCEDSHKYALGLKILTLSDSVKMSNIIIRYVHPYLEKLTEQLEETTHCAIESNNTVIYLDKVTSNSSIYINTQVGTKNYMHCTGVGKCLLAYLPSDKQERIFQSNLKTMTYNTITNVERLKDEIHNIRKNGYALDNEEIEIGLSCVAVPVFSSVNTVAFSISVSGSTSRINDKYQDPKLLDTLWNTSIKISHEIYNYELVSIANK